jgi:hypothetical protein
MKGVLRLGLRMKRRRVNGLDLCRIRVHRRWLLRMGRRRRRLREAVTGSGVV